MILLLAWRRVCVLSVLPPRVNRDSRRGSWGPITPAQRSLTLNSHIGLPRRCSTVRTKGGVEASRCDSVRLSRLVYAARAVRQAGPSLPSLLHNRHRPAHLHPPSRCWVPTHSAARAPHIHMHTPPSPSNWESSPPFALPILRMGTRAGRVCAQFDARESEARWRVFAQFPARAQSASGAGHHGFTGHSRLLQRSGQRASRALATRAAGSRTHFATIARGFAPRR